MLVLTPTTVKNIEGIRVALETTNAILIQGEIGCGKSEAISYLAESAGCKETLIQVDVDDSFDSKDLLGKFSATDTPGSFEWKPGPLTTAVQEGYWILMEDIDLASFDVFSVLLSLLENSTLFISDRNRTLKAHPNFKLIATQQVIVSGDSLYSKKNVIPFQELWGTVIMNAVPVAERCQIVHQLCDRVPLAILERLTSLAESSNSHSNVINLRTLLRWGQRSHRRLGSAVPVSSSGSVFLSSTIREMLLKEAFDCFVARFPRGAEQTLMLSLIADACEVPLSIAEALTMDNKPTQSIGTNGCTFGRINLPLFSLSQIQRDSRIVFAETQQAMSLLERLAGAVESKEHVLLTGETGVGKTFVVQYLADQLGQELIVHNLNQQTDTSDFMGGWKPLDLGITMRELFDTFTSLFGRCFNVEKNSTFLSTLQMSFSERNWEKTARLLQKGCLSFEQKKTQSEFDGDVVVSWNELTTRIADTLNIITQTNSSMAFFFEEGSLVKAWREGHWILLDELNLATTEVLERVSSVLGDVDRLFLTDKGTSEAIPRHKNFHVFANMNPPTDVGKKDLPPSLRSRFTEFFVSEPFNEGDINIIVREYIGFLSPDSKVGEITDFFLDCVHNAKSKLCTLDGESKPPSFSMRTLTRALSYVRKATPWYGFNVSLLDGLLLGFATPLQRQFHKVVEGLIVKNIFKGKQPPPPKLPTQPEGDFTPYQHIWIKSGAEIPFKDDSFILTESVEGHLTNLARAVFAQRPVLLEGPTSSGKSSMVKYLAELTGNKFVRINNHESTEVQEYLGHYVTDEYGKLRFVDGILVNAVRNGSWVVLDELNLAPTDVLEALNRLLDDNCELFIPDTQETIRPHPDLRIFATQNPAGIYGGRKMLSRAFRNRFLEITVDDIPTAEIVSILRLRYSMPESFAQKIVEVMTNLQTRRQNSQIFAGRHGFITPRDLFRWAERKPATYQQLAEHGFLLLGERCRKPSERQIVKDVIESVTKTELSEEELYKPSHWDFVKKYYDLIEEGSIDEFKIVWTESMQRLFTIVGICLEHCEPVLLVGETGSSKTTVCQLWAALLGVPLRIINCHQHTEAADFLGSLRPVPPDRREQALFEWRDGPLVESMRSGDFFLMDEISLTEDSVLERLNSVLEPSRSITLAEKSSGETFAAHDRFRVLATMNPGGDFGKKELSPALRNRFTEVYVRPTTDEGEVAVILSKRLVPDLRSWAIKMARVLCGISSAVPTISTLTHISIRDIITWVEFMNAVNGKCSDASAFVHGLDALLLDGIGVGSGQSDGANQLLRETCIREAQKALEEEGKFSFHDEKERPFWEVVTDISAPQLPPHLQSKFFFGAPTTQRNLSKLMRSTVLRKAVLLEGSPGVGKTSIVEALGAALGVHVVRINLSEQTDVMDLFGTFLPQPSEEDDDGKPKFAWSDGVLLQALKQGCWAILDELNLASQSVLEGLNALLDHRAAVFIPELNMEFHAHPHFRVFACQNPLGEGGGRKGLPKSFLNRFVKVRVDAFSREDLISITEAVCSDIATETLNAMVGFVEDLQSETMVRRTFGLRGSPWEFNLRDVLRWAGLMRRYDELENPTEFCDLLFTQRFRTEQDREECRRLLSKHFPRGPQERKLSYSCDFLLAGSSVVYRGIKLVERTVPMASEEETASQTTGLQHANEEVTATLTAAYERPLLLLPSQAEAIASVLMCAAHQQFCMLIGASGSGKSSVLKVAAALAGAKLSTFSMNASCDTIDLLGGFDQVDGKQGQFEWRDSLILEAMLLGHWLVLDNVNYCNASVLDRLNPLVEPNGVLFVNEQGLVNGETRMIRPHPNFRMFATLNPRYGEISRAMRNRAVEICLAPVSVPSMESSVLCSSIVPNSTDPAIIPPASQKLLTALIQFHHRFIMGAYHADAQHPFSGPVADAIAAGSPNAFTLLRASSMLSHSWTVEGLQQAVHHCYLDNRVGSWLHRKQELSEYLRLRCDELANDSEEASTGGFTLTNGPRLCDAADAFTMGDEHAVSLSYHLNQRLLHNRIVRSGMGLLKMVHDLNEPQLLADALMHFVLEQSSDSMVVNDLSGLRREFVESCGLPEGITTAALTLLHPKYCTPSSLPHLFSEAFKMIGRHAEMLHTALRSEAAIQSFARFTESPSTNTATVQLLTSLHFALRSISHPVSLQQLVRVIAPLLHSIQEMRSTTLTMENFVPLVTRAVLLYRMSESEPSLCSVLLPIKEATEGFLIAIQRQLTITYPLMAPPSILADIVPPTHITTEEERQVVEECRKVRQAESTEAEGKDHATRRIVRPLWEMAAFRAEFHLIQMGSRLITAPHSILLPRVKQLTTLTEQFIEDFTVKMPLFTPLDLVLWKSAMDVLASARHWTPSSGNGAAMEELTDEFRKILPLIVCSFYQRFDLGQTGSLFFASWSSQAARCARFVSDVPLASMDAKDSMHHRALASLTAFLQRCPRADSADPFILWRQNTREELYRILTCCLTSAAPLCEEAAQATPEGFAAMMKLVDDELATGSPNCLIPASQLSLLRHLLSLLTAASASQHTLSAMVLQFALKCRLLLPSTPIDPMYCRSLEEEVARSERDGLRQSAEVHLWCDRISQRVEEPAPERPVYALLEQLTAQEEASQEEAAAGLVQRPDPTGIRFAVLTRELHRVSSSLLSEERLSQVVATTAESRESRGHWAELLYQEMVELLQQFGGYEDATLNLAQSAFFSAAASQYIYLETEPHADLKKQTASGSSTLFESADVLQQIAFPSVRCLDVPLPADGVGELPRRLRYLDSCLTLLQGCIPQSLTSAFVAGLFAAYRDLYRNVEEQREQERLAAEMSVKYKEKSLQIEGDDERMRRKLQSMFPSYEKDFAVEEEDEEGSAEEAAAAQKSKALHQSSILFSEKDGACVRRMVRAYTHFYVRLAGGRLLQGDKLSMESFLQFYKSHFDAITTDLSDVPSLNPLGNTSAQHREQQEDLLFNGFATRIALLQKELSGSALTSVSERNSAAFNIYRDPDLSEVRQFSLPLQRLMRRFDELLATFPDNVTLLQCRSISQKIAQLSPLRTPLMKVMTGCEILLRQCYEWERNAAHTVSLMTHMTELSSFVLRWRRLELHCWEHVFTAKREEFELTAALEWFQIYDVIHVREEADDEVAHGMRLFQCLSQYMWKSCLGDFTSRLNLVRGAAFELAASEGLTAPLTNVATHLTGFFSQFEKLVLDKCETDIEPLRRDMSEFCQVMRWEDANYYAVRATVEKSHLKVGRMLSSLEDVLRKPILQLIAEEEDRCEEDASMGFPMPEAKKSKKKPKKAKEEEKGGKKRSRSGQPMSSKTAKPEPTALLPPPSPAAAWMTLHRGCYFFRDGADEMVSTIASLQAPKTPQQMKIRALKMFFERLEEAGVPFTHEIQVDSWDVLYASTEGLLGCETAFAHLPGATHVAELSKELYRLCRWVQRMRESERHPHQDLSGAQVKRGTGTAESLLSHLSVMTRWLVHLFELQEQLASLETFLAASQANHRIEGCEGTQGLVPTPPSHLASSPLLLQESVRLACALRVVCESAAWMDCLSPSKELSASTSSDDRSLVTEFHSEVEKLWQLCVEYDALRCTDLPLPAAVTDRLTQQHRRLIGLCGRLQRHSSPAVRAAVEGCEMQIVRATDLQQQLAKTESDVEWSSEGRPESVRSRRRVEHSEDEGVSHKESRQEALQRLTRDLASACEAMERREDRSPLPSATLTEGSKAEEDGDDNDEPVRPNTYKEFLQWVELGSEGTSSVLASLAAFTSSISSADTAAAAMELADLASAHRLAQRTMRSVEEVKAAMLEAASSHAHFSIVTTRLIAILLKKGFCKSEDEEENDGEGDGDGGVQSGTGMDDGEGEKDVTNEMENEDQLMNMKDKEEQEQDKDKQGSGDDNEDEEDNAADVQTDFAGDKEQREESEDDEEGDETDQEMGDVSEDDDVQDRKKSKTEQNEALSEDEGEDDAENVPKDEFDEQKDELDDDEDTGGFDDRENEIRDAEEDAEDDGAEKELMADAKAIEDEDEDDSGSEDDRSRSDGEEREESEEDDEKSVDNDEEARESRDGSEEREKQGDADDDGESNGEQEIDEEGSHSEGSDDDISHADDAPDENTFDGGQQDERTGEEATENQKEKQPQKNQDDAAGTDEAQPGDEQEQDDSGRNWKKEEHENSSSKKKDDSQKNRSESRNPYKAMKEALQRHQQPPQQLNLNRRVDKETNEEEETKKDPRRKEERLKDEPVEDFQLDEEGEEEGLAATDLVEPTETKMPEEASDEESDGSDGGEEEGENEDDTRRKRASPQDITDAAEESDEEEGNEKKQKRKASKSTAAVRKEEAEDEESEDAIKKEEEQEEDPNDKLTRGRHRWQEHEAAVQGLAMQLCEQLRLILAPTLADKLQGDYKTGKRLNMKRIIPYIASQFKKDRIWLRRTKPNKRTYQIMVAIDDSLSMQCREAGEFSCRALVLMAKALQQLEVGEVGVTSFGESMRMLHGLDETFTGETGPFICSELTFSQESTKMCDFLTSVLTYMDEAKERMSGQSRGSTELQQLLYIFSDGQITESRPELKKLMVRAEENHQMVVFVILDVKASSGDAGGDLVAQRAAAAAPLKAENLKGLSTAERLRALKADREKRLQRVQSQSVLDMQLVEFSGSKVIRKSYLDDFPFPYYLIIREFERLPDIIADSMRQWFELLNGH